MLRVLPTVIEPETWTVAFHRTSPYWWVRLLACGRYKHVSAFAWVGPLRLWVVVDVTLGGLKLRLLPDSKASERWLCDYSHDADLIRFRRPEFLDKFPPPMPLYCVPAIKALIGLRCGALRPDALWRHMLANGGELIDARVESADTDRQPGNRRAAGTGEA